MVEQALSGLKVLDLSHYIAGPYCTRILAGFGAGVIKIEKPDTGDPARQMGPFLDNEPGPERSGLFLYLNGNKQSVTLNLKSATGVQIFKELLKDADVVVESFQPGTMARFGLAYPTLDQINPRLVMTSISNFGKNGRYRDYKAAHLIVWGMSGGPSMNDEPSKRPVQGGGWLTHYVAGLFGLVGTATALYQRNETGIGQQVDVSMLESNMLITAYPTTVHSYVGAGHAWPIIPRDRLGVLSCQDGYIGANFLSMAQWELMCSFFGMPELVKDPRFLTKQLIIEHLDEAQEIFSAKLKDRRKMELFHSAQASRIPFGLVPTTKEVIDSPQHQARGFFEEVDHPVMGRVTMPGAPFKLLETPWQPRSPAPLLGEHNQEVYGERLGYSRGELTRLRQQGVI